MRGKVSPELLASCLADVESGRLTIEECVATHPVVAEELRSLLETAFSIALPPSVVPDPQFRLRGRVALIEAITAETNSVTNSSFRRFWRVTVGSWGPPTQPLIRRMGMPALIIALVIALTAAGSGGAVYASQDALPGDALYQVKTAVEGLQLTLAASDEAKAQTYLDIAAKRLAEADKASQRGNAAAASAAAGAFVRDVAQADRHLTQAAASGKDVSELVARLDANLIRHQQALAAAGERAPEQAKAALSRAAEAAEKGLTNASARVQNTSGGRPGNTLTRQMTGTVALE